MSEIRLLFRGTLFPIRNGELTLGRSSYASIVVNNPLASREHAVVRMSAGRLELVDLGSKNGTFLNGERVTGTNELRVSDRIRIGADEIEVVRVSVEDPKALRVPTYPGRIREDGDTTVQCLQAIDLAEVLVNSCPSDAQRRATAETVAQIIDSFLSEVPTEQIEPESASRVCRVLSVIASWNLGPAVEQWSRSVGSRFGA